MKIWRVLVLNWLFGLPVLGRTTRLQGYFISRLLHMSEVTWRTPYWFSLHSSFLPPVLPASLKQHSYKNATNRYKSLYRGLSPYQDWFISKMLTKFETKSARVKGWFMFFYLSFSWASFWLSFVNIFKLFHQDRVTACVCVLFNICFLCIIGLNRITVSQIFLTRPNSLLAKCSGNDHL